MLIFDHYLKNLKVDRFQEFLQKAQIFKNKSSSLSDIELAIDKVSRIVFSLRRYLNTESQLIPSIHPIIPHKPIQIHSTLFLNRISRWPAAR